MGNKVRSLDHIKGFNKSVRKLVAPPAKAHCRHIRTKKSYSGETVCLDCNQHWDWNGIAFDPMVDFEPFDE